MATSLEMARIASADGIEIMACTPHITPGVYDSTAADIRAAIDRLSAAIDEAGIELFLVSGADIHVAPDLVEGFRAGRLLSLNGSRYFLLEPPHQVLPPRFEEFALAVMSEGYVPILTHPERLSWIDGHYDTIERLSEAGVLMQLTGGSVTGQFGRKPRYWSERMLNEGKVDLLASDAHNIARRPPVLSEARDAVARRLGNDEAERLLLNNPRRILENVLPSELARSAGKKSDKIGGLLRWARGAGKN
jgi:protein-tyrosine phosphatase